jgi:von Willebrand factor type A domain
MKRLTALTQAVLALALVACSGDDPPVQEGLDTHAPVLNDSRVGDDFMAGDGSNDGGDSGQELACRARNEGTACVGQTYAGESIPLDIYIMFDQSGSMCSCLDPDAAQTCPNPACGETRLDAVRNATERFLLDPESAGIGVGLGLFGKQPIGQASCDVADYAAATVGVGPVPEHAASVVQALGQLQPTGETPTGAAIRGACSYAGSWKRQVPHHQVVILLLTDGKPEAPVTCQGGEGACCPSLDDAVTAAEECRTGSEIETYVLGVGPLLGNLEQIAVAGGTDRAYLVEGGDVSAQVLDALNRIRGAAAIPCQLQLPQPPNGQTLAFDKVNLEYESSECESTLLYSVQNAAECGSEDGWYYDDPANPQTIHLCPGSCDRVSAPGGSLQYSVGCATQFRIR